MPENEDEERVKEEEGDEDENCEDGFISVGIDSRTG
jgi:hypothetical protein